MAVERAIQDNEKFANFLIDSPREWLTDVKDGKKELTVIDLAGILDSISSYKIRKHPDNTPIPDEFTIPGSKGPIAVSYARGYNPSIKINGMRYVDDKGEEIEFDISGGTDSMERAFRLLDPENPDAMGEPFVQIPEAMVPGIVNELLVGLKSLSRS